MSYDLLIKNAKTRFSQGEVIQIAIQDGKIVKIGTSVNE